MTSSSIEFVCKTCSNFGVLNDSIVCVNCRLRNHVTCSTQIDQFPDLVARFKCNACYSIEGYLGSTRHCSSAASNNSNTAHDNASIKSLIDSVGTIATFTSPSASP